MDHLHSTPFASYRTSLTDISLNLIHHEGACDQKAIIYIVKIAKQSNNLPGKEKKTAKISRGSLPCESCKFLFIFPTVIRFRAVGCSEIIVCFPSFNLTHARSRIRVSRLQIEIELAFGSRTLKNYSTFNKYALILIRTRILPTDKHV